MECRPTSAIAKGNSLSQVVAHFLACQSSCPRDELRAYSNKPLKTAIAMAAHADRGDGKKHSHQWNLFSTTATRAESILLNSMEAIAACKDFASLHELIKTKLNIPGAGEMYWYDTAFRIGISQGIYPDAVYLHRGTRIGAENLGIAKGKDVLQMSELPPELQGLRPYEVEDFLCLYHEDLAKIRPPAEPAAHRQERC